MVYDGGEAKANGEKRKKRDNMNRYTHWHTVMYECTYVWNINVRTYIHICCSSITILLCTRLRHRKRINQLCTHEWTVLEAIKQQLAVLSLYVYRYTHVLYYITYTKIMKKNMKVLAVGYMLLVQRKLLVQYLCNVIYIYIDISKLIPIPIYNVFTVVLHDVRVSKCIPYTAN